MGGRLLGSKWDDWVQSTFQSPKIEVNPLNPKWSHEKREKCKGNGAWDDHGTRKTETSQILRKFPINKADSTSDLNSLTPKLPKTTVKTVINSHFFTISRKTTHKQPRFIPFSSYFVLILQNSNLISNKRQKKNYLN